eukprot:scaffold290907_cov53-Attheya_sp.AAC.3
MPLLHQREVEKVIDSVDRDFLSSPDNRRRMFFLGGIPRPSVQFAALKQSFDMVWANVTCKGTEFSFADLVQLFLAAAVSGRKFSRGENANIKDSTWGRLSDEGVCIMEGDS